MTARATHNGWLAAATVNSIGACGIGIDACRYAMESRTSEFAIKNRSHHSTYGHSNCVVHGSSVWTAAALCARDEPRKIISSVKLNLIDTLDCHRTDARTDWRYNALRHESRLVQWFSRFVTFVVSAACNIQTLVHCAIICWILPWQMPHEISASRLFNDYFQFLRWWLVTDRTRHEYAEDRRLRWPK